MVKLWYTMNDIGSLLQRHLLFIKWYDKMAEGKNIKVADCFLRGEGCQAMSGCHLVSAFWWPGAGSLGLWSRGFFPRLYLKVTVLGGLMGAGASFIEWKARLVALISDIVDLVSILTLLLIITAISLWGKNAQLYSIIMLSWLYTTCESRSSCTATMTCKHRYGQ